VEAAQDLTQETFLCLFESLSKGHRIEKLRPWLFTVASRIAVRQLERFRSEAIHDVPDIGELISAQAHTDDPEQSVLNSERKRNLSLAMQTLSPQQRVCLHLRAEGLRYREIAKVTLWPFPQWRNLFGGQSTGLRIRWMPHKHQWIASSSRVPHSSQAENGGADTGESCDEAELHEGRTGPVKHGTQRFFPILHRRNLRVVGSMKDGVR
jgi:Sigma-70 region 2